MVKRNRMTVYLLVLVFVGPLILAYALYTFRDHFQFKPAQHGYLITPPISVKKLVLNEPSLTGKWQLVFILSPSSDTNCQQFSNTLNNLYIALGRERHRVIQRTVSVENVPLEFSHDRLLIIDPKGWLIMSYPDTINPKDILEDVRRLLRFSHVG